MPVFTTELYFIGWIQLTGLDRPKHLAFIWSTLNVNPDLRLWLWLDRVEVKRFSSIFRYCSRVWVLDLHPSFKSHATYSICEIHQCVDLEVMASTSPLTAQVWSLGKPENFSDTYAKPKSMRPSRHPWLIREPAVQFTASLSTTVALKHVTCKRLFLERLGRSFSLVWNQLACWYHTTRNH